MSGRSKKEILSGVRETIVESKIVDRNTIMYKTPEGETRYRLHDTDIVTLKKNGTVVLNTGGWNTVTTRDRMNSFSPFRVNTVKGVLYVTTPQGSYPLPREATIKKDGTIVGLRKVERARASLELKATKIKAFCERIMTLETLPLPSTGDCWLCLMKDKDGKTMGDLSRDTEHLWSHVKEGYLHGSLILNAMKANGMGDYYFHLYFSQDKTPLEKSIRLQVKRALTRYLRKAMGLS